jgi:V8-like Glu-specific endopeptidase
VYQGVKKFMLRSSLLKIGISLGVLALSYSAFAMEADGACEECARLSAQPQIASNNSQLDELRKIQNSEQIRNLQIYYQDDMEQHSREAGQLYGPIGVILDPVSKHTGTAFLISKCEVLTAKHTISETAQIPTNQLQVKFFVGQGDYEGFEKPISGTIIKAGTYDAAKNNREDDWALVRLDNCVGSKYGFVDIAPVKPNSLVKNNVELKIAGYLNNKDHKQGVWVDPSCKVKETSGSVLLHDCATQPQTSGAPIFYLSTENGKQHVKVVGLHTSAVQNSEIVSTWDVQTSNQAASMDHIFPQIKSLLTF